MKGILLSSTLLSLIVSSLSCGAREVSFRDKAEKSSSEKAKNAAETHAETTLGISQTVLADSYVTVSDEAFTSSGNWVAGIRQAPAAYKSAAAVKENIARWKFAGSEGLYLVRAMIVKGNESTERGLFRVANSEGIRGQWVNFKSGQDGWVSLGRHYFAGTDQGVSLSADGTPSETIHASTVAFIPVRQNEEVIQRSARLSLGSLYYREQKVVKVVGGIHLQPAAILQDIAGVRTLVFQGIPSRSWSRAIRLPAMEINGEYYVGFTGPSEVSVFYKFGKEFRHAKCSLEQCQVSTIAGNIAGSPAVLFEPRTYTAVLALPVVMADGLEKRLRLGQYNSESGLQLAEYQEARTTGLLAAIFPVLESGTGDHSVYLSVNSSGQRSSTDETTRIAIKSAGTFTTVHTLFENARVTGVYRGAAFVKDSSGGCLKVKPGVAAEKLKKDCLNLVYKLDQNYRSETDRDTANFIFPDKTLLNTSLRLTNFNRGVLHKSDMNGRPWVIMSRDRVGTVYRIYDKGAWTNQIPLLTDSFSVQPDGNIMFYGSSIQRDGTFTWGSLK
jgi:hypothetical protein